MGDPDDKPLTVVKLNPAIIAGVIGHEPLEVVGPVDLSVVVGLAEPPTILPMQEPASYTIRTTPPDGETTAFSSGGVHTVDHYDNAIFFLGMDGRGTFTIRGGLGFLVEGTGTVTAAEVRTEFEAPNRDIRGVFTFPRGGQTGEVKLTNGNDRLVARATIGVTID